MMRISFPARARAKVPTPARKATLIVRLEDVARPMAVPAPLLERVFLIHAAARAAHPERFGAVLLPKILHLPDEAWINRPEQQQPEDEQQIA
jgi:hypothetical protein